MSRSATATMLAEVDALRACGVTEFVGLPQIVVCCDHTAEKHAVLEAIAGIELPCSTGNITLTIRPAEIHEVVTSPDETVVDVHGPGLPLIRLVSLPALEENNGEAAISNALEDPLNIIVVIYSSNDSKTAAMVHEHDPTGARTLNVICDPEDDWNEITDFSESRRSNSGDPERIYGVPQTSVHFVAPSHDESAFFSTDSWRGRPSNTQGTPALRTRLANRLALHLRTSLTSIRETIQSGLDAAVDDLATPPSRTPLLAASALLTPLLRAATSGQYGNHSFFATPTLRLRSTLTTLTSVFDDGMRSLGATRRSHSTPSSPANATHADLIAWVTPHVPASRLHHAAVLAELFAEQSEPWSKTAGTHLEIVFCSVSHVFRRALDTVLPAPIAERVWDDIVEPALSARLGRARHELAALIADHRRPIMSYPPRFLARLRSLRLARLGPTVDTATLDTPAEAAEALLDAVNAWYEMAEEGFIENVRAIVLERCIVDGVDEVFGRSVVEALPRAAVGRLVGREDERAETERVRDVLARAVAAINALRVRTSNCSPACDITPSSSRGSRRPTTPQPPCSTQPKNPPPLPRTVFTPDPTDPARDGYIRATSVTLSDEDADTVVLTPPRIVRASGESWFGGDDEEQIAVVEVGLSPRSAGGRGSRGSGGSRASGRVSGGEI
ncbi:hypothetical protein EDC01DRAFT_320899 [Geopyxis carbonaria]|nr:hypothetical protein EDC01DRAFT_320899 [Geopyxis carbonaria]